LDPAAPPGNKLVVLRPNRPGASTSAVGVAMTPVAPVAENWVSPGALATSPKKRTALLEIRWVVAIPEVS
jgi:hypothetical protein